MLGHLAAVDDSEDLILKKGEVAREFEHIVTNVQSYLEYPRVFEYLHKLGLNSTRMDVEENESIVAVELEKGYFVRNIFALAAEFDSPFSVKAPEREGGALASELKHLSRVEAALLRSDGVVGDRVQRSLELGKRAIIIVIVMTLFTARQWKLPYSLFQGCRFPAHV